MSLRPAKLKAGTALLLRPTVGNGPDYAATFVRREPAMGRGETRTPALNVLHVPTFNGWNGPDDKGYMTMTDHALMRHGRLA